MFPHFFNIWTVVVLVPIKARKQLFVKRSDALCGEIVQVNKYNFSADV